LLSNLAESKSARNVCTVTVLKMISVLLPSDLLITEHEEKALNSVLLGVAKTHLDQRENGGNHRSDHQTEQEWERSFLTRK
jgi:hypothetical protein